MARASVVVCTHSRSQALGPCLEQLVRHLERDSTCGGQVEILLVDNASRDDTSAVAAAALAGATVPTRVIAEPVLGLSHARNRGIGEARGNLIVFLDDDAYPHPGWLDELLQAFDDPAVEASGGPIDPRFDGPLPDWLGPRYLPYLSAWDLGPTPQRLTYNEYPRGANIAFRRSALERVGPFSPRLGRRGTRLASCEEIELCLRIERTEGTIAYVPGARIDHVVPTARLDAFWMARRFHWQGRSEAVLDWIHGGFPALRTSHRRIRRYRAEAAASGDLLATAFHRATLLGYRLGCVEAIGARRFNHRGLARWSPPS